MPWEDGTLTADDVATHLGVPVDQRMTDATDATRAFVQRMKEHQDPLAVWSDPLIHMAGREYAGMWWRSKAAVVGFASYEPQDGSDYTLYVQCMRHFGAADPVVA